MANLLANINEILTMPGMPLPRFIMALVVFSPLVLTLVLIGYINYSIAKRAADRAKAREEEQDG